MEESYWHNKWQENNIGFHEKQANELLVKHVDELGLEPGARIFLPLCGKTLDISWLLSKGYQVVGAEFSKLAVDQLFIELGVKPEITKEGKLAHYQAEHIDLFVGDVFHLSADQLGGVDAVYDRAALVALTGSLRLRYKDHLMKISQHAPQLLICFEYDQQQMEGPPFSIRGEDVKHYYEGSFEITSLERKSVAGKFKGKIEATETVWLLKG